MDYTFKAKLWVYEGKAAWYFVTLPIEVAEEIKLRTAGYRPAFGSVKVSVQVGGSKWTTSLFPEGGDEGSYVLPIKKQVRENEDLADGDKIDLSISPLNIR